MTRKEAQEQARKDMRRTRRKHGYRQVDINDQNSWEVYEIEVDYGIDFLRKQVELLWDEIKKINEKKNKE